MDASDDEVNQYRDDDDDNVPVDEVEVRVGGEFDGEDYDDYEMEGEELEGDMIDVSIIAALAPKVGDHEESHFEVSASPAFHELDMLLNEGRVTNTKVALLKSKYTELHDTLKSKRVKEQQLLQQAKQFANMLEKQKTELEKADIFPDESDTTETGKMRTQLLKQNNEYAQTTDRLYKLQYTFESLEEDKRMLEKEYARLPKASEVEKKMDDLKQASLDLRREINQRKLEAKTLKEDLDNNNRQNVARSKEIEALGDTVEQFKSEVVLANSRPNLISKECDKLSRSFMELEKQTREVDEEISNTKSKMAEIQAKLIAEEDEKQQLDIDLKRSGVVHSEKEREYQVLVKDYEYAKDRETVLQVDKSTLDMNLRHLQMEKINLHELISSRVREKDHSMRMLKKAEIQLKLAHEALEIVKLSHLKVKNEASSRPSDDGGLQKRREDLHREVQQVQRSIAQQNSLTTSETIRIEQSVAEEERLLYEQSDLRIEVVELTRLAAIKNDEKIQKLRDLQRAELSVTQVNEDKRIKQIQLDDHKKKDREMQIRLKEYAQLYDVIKNERNKCVSLIQMSNQKASEMNEKTKILENEMEILRTSALQKDKLLQKHRMKQITGIIVRDTLRHELSKQCAIEEALREKREQQRIDITKLNLLINQSEAHMVDLRKRYEAEILNRNNRGVQLIERNEEVCVFYEKVNIQDEMIRNGEIDLRAKEEELRFLKMTLVEEKRKRGILKKRIPNKRAVEEELVTLQIQLAQCQDRQMELEKLIENPGSNDRVRLIGGHDPTPTEMQSRFEELEARLAIKEEQSLEKDLIYEQVARLTQRVYNKVESGKEPTIKMAKTMNDLQAQEKQKTRKMMANVSELAMLQAKSLRLQQEVKEREALLQQCYINMEKGEAPSQEAEQEWVRHVNQERQRRQEREAVKMMAAQEEIFTLPDGSVSTAEPRPNAYVPDDEHNLPIPRPYGQNAPFKPQEAGSNMRHIRKPVPKPIEL